MKILENISAQQISWVKSNKKNLEAQSGIKKLYYPEALDELKDLIMTLNCNNEQYDIIGYSSNTLFFHHTQLTMSSVQNILTRGPVIAILPVTNYLYSRFTPEFIENHILAYIAEANEVKVPVKNYLTDERFTDPSLYINSFFFNTKGRKKFTKQFVEDLRVQSIL